MRRRHGVLVEDFSRGGPLPVETGTVPGGAAALGIGCSGGEEGCSNCGDENGFSCQTSELTSVGGECRVIRLPGHNVPILGAIGRVAGSVAHLPQQIRPYCHPVAERRVRIGGNDSAICRFAGFLPRKIAVFRIPLARCDHDATVPHQLCQNGAAHPVPRAIGML